MPPKKKTLAEVVEATSNRPMKLRSPAKRKPAKVHTPEPAAKKGVVTKPAAKKQAACKEAGVVTTKVQPSAKPPQKPPLKETTKPTLSAKPAATSEPNRK